MDAFRPGFAVLRALRDACKPELLRQVVIMILGFPKALWPYYAYGFGDISLSGFDHDAFSSYQSATWIALKGSCASGNSL